jgi:glycosyltransferase involved in cell wall biosynthesis
MSIIYDILSVLHAVASGQRHLLILGTSGAIIIPLLRILCPSARIVTNIDGIEWRREKWEGIAKWFLKFSEGVAVKYSTKVVADNRAIADYVHDSYERKCETIAYGGDHALVALRHQNMYFGLDIGRPYAFSLCRIEPENNVSLILEAFAGTNQDLIFIGNWRSSEYGRVLQSKFSEHSNLRLLNPIYDIETLCAYRTHCRVYIHGHSAGGTNPSLVEMMHFGKPIAAFDCSYNRATMEDNGVFFTSVDNLRAIITDNAGFSGGEVLLEVAQRRYTWNAVRSQYLALFE